MRGSTPPPSPIANIHEPKPHTCILSQCHIWCNIHSTCFFIHTLAIISLSYLIIAFCPQYLSSLHVFVSTIAIS
ncbi:hypothetical protein GYMLUDRAFT_913476 [Collybiopsis luxurians FD-317 M1]|nr:hypothetical protein GYMLUDRAFT_913476 [Collybiopsis luxurians FD-317 M1]